MCPRTYLTAFNKYRATAVGVLRTAFALSGIKTYFPSTYVMCQIKLKPITNREKILSFSIYVIVGLWHKTQATGNIFLLGSGSPNNAPGLPGALLALVNQVILHHPICLTTLIIKAYRLYQMNLMLIQMNCYQVHYQPIQSLHLYLHHLILDVISLYRHILGWCNQYVLSLLFLLVLVMFFF